VQSFCHKEERTLSRRVVCLAALLGLASCGTPPAAEVPATAAPTVRAAESCRVLDGRADARCTPGALNPDVTQDTIHSTICAPGWTETAQPPASYGTALKLQQMRDFGETGSPLNYKEDHLVPLSIGGAPRDPHNLFPQPTAKTTEKEDLEDQLHKQVCSGQMTLAAAQEKMRHGWTH